MFRLKKLGFALF